MPGGILPASGIQDQLAWILQAAIPGVLPWQLLLWSNDYVPDYTTVYADLVESTWMGYSRANLTRATWTYPSLTADCAVSTWGTSAINWFVTGGPTEWIRGYAMVDMGSNLLRFVQRFDDADIVQVSAGGRFQLLPRYTLTTGQC